MMTQGHRQEALCRAYVQAVAAKAGLLLSRPEPDYGIDLSLRMVEIRGRHHLDTSVQVDLQLKSTMQASVTDSAVKYDLEVDAYEYLRRSEPFCPRILVVLVLPADEDEWVKQSPEELTIRQCAYWLSLTGAPATTATKTIRVAIPPENVFSVQAVQALLQRIKERREP
jgi:hypothetical protein